MYGLVGKWRWSHWSDHHGRLGIHGLAHIEQLLMEVFGVYSLGDEIPPQYLAKPGGAAKPYVARRPFRDSLAYALDVQEAIRGVDQNVQIHLGFAGKLVELGNCSRVG